MIVKDTSFEYQQQDIILNLDSNNNFGQIINQTKNLNVIWVQSIQVEYNRDSAVRMDRLLNELKLIYIQDPIV